MKDQEIQFQNIVEKKKSRIDALEIDIKRCIEAIDGINHDDQKLFNKYKNYIKWCTSILKLKGKKLSHIQKSEIENKLEIYKKEFSELTVSYGSSFNSSFVKDPIMGYGNFLQCGLKFYTKNIDVYKIMLEMDEVYYLAYIKTPNFTSYSFIALLARYILPKNSILYKQIYPAILGKVKEALPHVYNNPSFENVTGLLLLSFISLSHFNTTACIRYFGLAVRMAQSLGCDKMEEESSDSLIIDEMDSYSVKKGIQVWNSISTIYTLLITFIPNFPLFRIKLKPSNNGFLNSKPFNRCGESKPTCCCAKSPTILSSISDEPLKSENIVLHAQIEILSHVQNVRLEKSKMIRIELVPPRELRLPKCKFNKVASILIDAFINEIPCPNIVSEIVIGNAFNNLASHLSSSKTNLLIYRWNCFRQATVITLYYPSVLIFPQAVKLSFDEAITLYEAAQFVTEYYFNIDYIKSNCPQLLPEASISCIANNDGFGRTYYSPYYIQLTYALYVYLCFICEYEWLLSQGLSKDKLSHCEVQVLKIINFLNHASRSSITNERKDLVKTLENIKLTLKNYIIPEPFYSTLKSYMSPP